MPNLPPAREDTDFASRGKLIRLIQEALPKTGVVEGREGSYRQPQDGMPVARAQVGHVAREVVWR